MTVCIDVRGLEKRYGDLEAVAGITFAVEEGEVFALLGPNGAGKTSTVEILEGHRPRTAGSVKVLGFDPETGGHRYRSRIGIVLQEAGLDAELTVREALQLFADFYPHPRRVDDLIDLVDLREKAPSRVKTLSGGQRRRLDLALSLVGDPDLLFLDEPTTGFDPEARHQAWRLLHSLRSLGKTIVLTSHYMDEVQHLADRVVVLAGGRIVATGSPHTLGGRDVASAVITFRLPLGASLAELPRVPGTVSLRDDEVIIRTDTPTRTLLALTNWATARGDELEALSIVRPTLEEVYLDLTGSKDAP